MDDMTRDKFIRWSAEMDLRYDKVFSIVDIWEKNIEKWGSVLPFYKNVQREGVFFGRQLKKSDYVVCFWENLFRLSMTRKRKPG